MYKNQLQELAQRSCFNLPSYTCIREGPDHAPRFKASVNFNGESYESPNFCTTLRQAEHSAAEVALNQLASQGSSNSLAARILDETGVYKNLLQEVSQIVGASLPTYTTVRSGLGHLPVFTCTVELAGCIFTGEPAKNKKQAEKNAAMSAWSSLKLLTQQSESLPLQKGNTEEQEHVTVARALQKFRLKARMSNIPFPIHFPVPKPKTLGQPTRTTTSKILPLICHKTGPSSRHLTTLSHTPQTCIKSSQKEFLVTPANEPPQPSSRSTENPTIPHQRKFPAVGAAPYIPIRHFTAHHGVAPPVTIRNSIPVFSAPPPRMDVAPPPANHLPPHFGLPPPMCSGVVPPVTIRQAVPVFAAVTKPVTNSTTPNYLKNTNSHEDSKSPIKPLITSSSTTEDKGSDATAISISPPVPDNEADEDKGCNAAETSISPPGPDKSVEAGLKELEI